MDITTVNDRHLYQARVVVCDDEAPGRRMELPGRVVATFLEGVPTVLDGKATR